MTKKPVVHNRRSIRLKGYDYSQAGAYFVTICTHQRLHRFGEIVAGEMNLNEFGRVAEEQWRQIPVRFDQVELGEFVVMPNHMHGILIIHEPDINVGAGLAPAQNDNKHQTNIGQPQGLPRRGLPQQDLPRRGLSRRGLSRQGCPDEGLPRRELSRQELPEQEISRQELSRHKTVGDIVGAYKSLVATECLKIYKSRNETMGKIWQRNYYERIIRDEKAFLKITEYIINNPYQWENDQYFAENR